MAESSSSAVGLTTGRMRPQGVIRDTVSEEQAHRRAMTGVAYFLTLGNVAKTVTAVETEADVHELVRHAKL